MTNHQSSNSRDLVSPWRGREKKKTCGTITNVFSIHFIQHNISIQICISGQKLSDADSPLCGTSSRNEHPTEVAETIHTSNSMHGFFFIHLSLSPSLSLSCESNIRASARCWYGLWSCVCTQCMYLGTKHFPNSVAANIKSFQISRLVRWK